LGPRKAQPLPLFTRNHAEPHDRGFTCPASVLHSTPPDASMRLDSRPVRESVPHSAPRPHTITPPAAVPPAVSVVEDSIVDVENSSSDRHLTSFNMTVAAPVGKKNCPGAATAFAASSGAHVDNHTVWRAQCRASKSII